VRRTIVDDERIDASPMRKRKRNDREDGLYDSRGIRPESERYLPIP